MEYLEKFHLVHSKEMMGPQLLSEWPGMSWIAGCLLLQIKSVSWVRFWTCPMIESMWCIRLNTQTSYTGLNMLLFYLMEFGNMFKLTRSSQSLEKKKGKKPPLGAWRTTSKNFPLQTRPQLFPQLRARNLALELNHGPCLFRHQRSLMASVCSHWWWQTPPH